MSDENVEIVQDTFRRIDPNDLTAFAALVHPECRMTPVEGWPEPGPFIGREAIVRQFERFLADVSETHFEEIEIVADSEAWVVMTWRWRTRGKASGIETQMDLAGAFRVQGGLIIETHFRWSSEEALEAAGLSK
jgi:ketosteroid isomerase-like protein